MYREKSGELELPNGVKLPGKADRIEIRNGQGAILDFKTGTQPTNEQVNAGLSPQMTLEAAMLARGAFKEMPTASAHGTHVLEIRRRRAEAKPRSNSTTARTRRARRRSRSCSGCSRNTPIRAAVPVQAARAIPEAVRRLRSPRAPQGMGGRGGRRMSARPRKSRHSRRKAPPIRWRRCSSPPTRAPAKRKCSSTASRGCCSTGAQPSAFLCITYTKAAAAEMQRRLFDRLGAWCVADDATLAEGT